LATIGLAKLSPREGRRSHWLIRGDADLARVPRRPRNLCVVIEAGGQRIDLAAPCTVRIRVLSGSQTSGEAIEGRLSGRSIDN
jgi:hypothetical protein